MSKLVNVCVSAYGALRRNVLRSLLTTLGIVIGITAVIATLEIGEGASATLERSIRSMGVNTLIVMPGADAAAGVAQGAGTLPTLTPDDVAAIQRECPAVRRAVPLVTVRTQVVYGSANWVPANMFGTSPEYLEIRDWTMLAEGEPFTERDVRNVNRVCVVGQTVAEELFGGESAVGKTIRVQNVPLRVVGVLSRKGANMVGMDQDDILIAPWTTIKYRISGAAVGQVNQSAADAGSEFGDRYPRTRQTLYPTLTETQIANSPGPRRNVTVDTIVAQADTPADIPAAMAQIQETLRATHQLRPGQVNDFYVRDLAELTKIFGATTTLMKNLLLCVALISLLVGGVGIMNIMLVSVTERTREIGLRMAVGAKARDILGQFLIEAVLLCLLGGALGIAFGRGLSLLVAGALNWPIAASPGAVAAAVAVSITVGLVFGFYPAWRASRLDPIEALRFE